MRRLNPFAFPPETNTRFVLVIIASLMITANAAGFLNTAVFDPVSAIAPDPSLPEDEFFAQQQANALFLAGEALQGTCILLFAIGLVFGVAFWHYRCHPARIRRRQKLETIDPAKDRTFQQAISTLSEHSGLKTPPNVEVAKGSQGTDGQAFGLPGKYSVRLGGRMPLLLRKSPKTFGATVLHEFGHIVNADIERTYFTQSLTLTTFIFVLAPMLVFFTLSLISGFFRRLFELIRGIPVDWGPFFFQAIPTWFIIVMQVALMATLVLVIRSGLLRVRELLADWRASLWGAEKDLTLILERNRTTEKPSAWHWLLRLHPPAHERLETLRDSSRLFRLNPDIPLIAGILIAITIGGMLGLAVFIGAGLLAPLFSLVGALGGRAVESNAGIFLILAQILVFVLGLLVPLIFIIPVLIIAYLVVETLGLQIEREALADLAMPARLGLGRYLRLVVPALLFALGFQVGLYIPPVNLFAPLQTLITENPIGMVLLPFTTLLWMVVFTALIWGWLAYARYVALRVLGKHSGANLPTRKRRFLSIILTVLLSFILIPGLLLQSALYEQLVGDVALSSFTVSTIVLLVVAVVMIGGAFVSSTVLFGAGGMLGKRLCPTCKQPTREAYSVGHACEHCGGELAAWLYVAD